MFTRARNQIALAALLTLFPFTPAVGQTPSIQPSCGKKPEFSGFTGQIAIATQLRSTNGPFANRSVMVWDLTDAKTAPLNVAWAPTSSPATHPYSHALWDVGHLGDIFGVTLDSIGNAYVTATRIYGSANNGSLATTGTPAMKAGQIYKIDALTGVPTAFVQLPNQGTGLGSIDHDPVHNTLLVTNFNGLIYQLDMTGAIQSTWNHGQNLPSAVGVNNLPLSPSRAAITGFEGSSPYAALGARPFAVRVIKNGTRAFYSVVGEYHWRFGHQPKLPSEIWSIALDGQGHLVGPARLEITLPPYSSLRPYTNPVAGMSFSATGDLVVAERTIGPGSGTSDAHLSRALKYTWNGTMWVLANPSTYQVGIPTVYGVTNAAGGVDHDFTPGGQLWATGDALHYAANDYIYGLQGLPLAGGTISNSILIDLNDDVTVHNKTQIGDVRIPCPPEGRLKICKVAGPGVPVGTPFTFTVGPNQQTVTVPAGPAPGGTCVVGPSFPVHSHVIIVETPTPGNTVSGIGVEPRGQLVNQSLTAGAVTVEIGAGVTEVTYTDKKTGYLEICKRTVDPVVTGTFQFYVNGTLGPFNVPVGACSPAIQVPAGTVTITEMPKPLTAMVGCSTIPTGHLQGCVGHTATVTVDPGDISHQTIAIITNRRIHFPFPTSGETSPTATGAPPGPAGSEPPAETARPR